MKYPLLLLSFLAAGALFAGRPVARWDVIPYQRVSSVFKAGVVAFHEKDVTVEFTVNGKPAHTATKPELNGRTKVWEFVFPFDAAKYPDGPVRLGAKVTAEGAAPYALPEIELYANSKKTQGSRKAAWVDPKDGNEFADGSKEHPVKSIKQAVQKCGDGGTVYLLPGTYQAKMIGGGKDRRFWTRIMPDYGHIDDETPSFAIALYPQYRGQGIGTALMERMLELLKQAGYRQASLSVQRQNRAAKLYQRLGFQIIGESDEEYLMLCSF